MTRFFPKTKPRAERPPRDPLRVLRGRGKRGCKLCPVVPPRPAGPEPAAGLGCAALGMLAKVPCELQARRPRLRRLLCSNTFLLVLGSMYQSRGQRNGGLG